VITAWRIVKASHVRRPFDGEGARLTGGRWNSPGTPMVYTAGSVSLAALEMLVHLSRAVTLASYVLIACRFSESLLERLERGALPHDWRAYPAPAALQHIGDEWIRRASSAVLEVPSAIIEKESNYLLNPAHRTFQSIDIGTPERFTFDTRLLKV
jgi:RES domain-containing protein